MDTSIFSAHSTRGASAYMASRMGVTTNDILQAANWLGVSFPEVLSQGDSGHLLWQSGALR